MSQWFWEMSEVERSAINVRMKEFNKNLRELKRNPNYRPFAKSRPVSWKDTRKPRNTYTLAEEE